MGNRKAGRFVLGFIAAAMAMASIGCIDNDKSLVIMFNVAPDDSCMLQIDPENIRTRGRLDLGHPAFGTPAEPVYYMFPQVHNYMPTNLSTANAELDAMAIMLRKATISYEWLIGRDSLGPLGFNNLLSLEEGEFEIFLSGVVSAASTSGSPGQLVTHLRLIPPDVGTQLAALGTDADDFVIGVHVFLEGTTLGGVDIQSNEFVYPIELCSGCLNLICPDGSPQLACNPGQDGDFIGCDE